MAAGLLLAVLAGYFRQAGCLSRGRPLEKITVSTSMSNVASMLLLAQAKGFF
jgi:hypothetical protein